MAEGEVAGIPKSLLGANTIIKADEAETPVALEVGPSRIIGRAAAGGIEDLTAAEVLTLLDAVAKSLFGANSILKADTAATPTSLTVAASRIVARGATGGIGAKTPAQILAILTGQAGADFSWNSKKLTNVADPTANQHAATKKYVDDNIPSAYGQGAGASRSSNQAITTSTAVSIVFDTEQFDNDTMWEGVTNPSRLTVKTAGLFIVTGQIQWAAEASGARYEFIYRNGAAIAQNFILAGSFGGGAWRRTLSTIWDASVNDYFELVVYQNSGGNLDVTTSGSYSPALQAVRIGP